MFKIIKNLIKKNECKANYNALIAKFKDEMKKRPLKVIFLVRENQKWAYTSLYRELEKNENFTPLVVVTILDIVKRGKDKTRNNLEENYKFFKNKNMNVEYAYKNGEYVDLKAFSPDIVFYDQPWDLPEIYKPHYVSKFALACYSPYGCELLDNKDDYTQDFHAHLFRFYIGIGENVERYEKYLKGNSTNCVVTGYPKLDSYLDKSAANCHLWQSNDKVKIIFAPHHSLDRNGLNLSTFKLTHKIVLEYAKTNSNITWVFKPHPRLKYALLRNKIMNESEIQKYFSEWEKLGSVYEKGDYLDLFKTSDLMLTDGCSFLYEYLPSGKPIIRLVNTNSFKFNHFGRKVMEKIYCVKNKTQFEDIMNNLVNKKNDFMREERIEFIKSNFDFNITGAEKIMEDLISNIF